MTQKLNFDIDKAIKLYNEDLQNNLRVPTNCYKYISDHVFPLKGGGSASHIVYENDKPIYYELAKLKQTYFNKMNKSISVWFFTEYSILYTIVSKLNKPRVYKNDDGHFLNIGDRFIHEKKPYDEYSQDIKNKVNLWISYLLEVFCDNRQEILDYLLKCYSVIARGGKLDVALYAKSIERTGKSFNTDFLMKYVIGDGLSTPSDSGPLKTQFNIQLLGKLLVVFEELDTKDSGEWKQMSSKLKQMITGSTYTYEAKCKNSIVEENWNNYFINTNTDAIKGADSNRYFCFDVSTKYTADSVYYSNLDKQCMNMQVGEAFYNYLLTINVDGFRAQAEMPMTRNKHIAIVDTMLPHEKFIKNEYILQKKGLDKFIKSDLYPEYMEFCNKHSKGYLTINKFNEALRNIGIYPRESTGNKLRATCSYEALLEIANKRKWICETDEFDSDATFVDNDITDEVEKVTQKYESKIKLIESKHQSELDALKQQIEELRKQIDVKNIEQLNKLTEKPKKTIKKISKKKPVVVEKDLTASDQSDDDDDCFDDALLAITSSIKNEPVKPVKKVVKKVVKKD